MLIMKIQSLRKRRRAEWYTGKNVLDHPGTFILRVAKRNAYREMEAACFSEALETM